MSEETNGIKCETVEALLDARRNANGILASAKNNSREARQSVASKDWLCRRSK